mgnify:CR=1 FL=1
MHQYKELIDDIDIKYIEMPNKLEWVILGSELYVKVITQVLKCFAIVSVDCFFNLI